MKATIAEARRAQAAEQTAIQVSELIRAVALMQEALSQVEAKIDRLAGGMTPSQSQKAGKQ